MFNEVILDFFYNSRLWNEFLFRNDSELLSNVCENIFFIKGFVWKSKFKMKSFTVVTTTTFTSSITIEILRSL